MKFCPQTHTIPHISTDEVKLQLTHHFVCVHTILFAYSYSNKNANVGNMNLHKLHSFYAVMLWTSVTYSFNASYTFAAVLKKYHPKFDFKISYYVIPHYFHRDFYNFIKILIPTEVDLNY